ncbi:MAG: DUF533 domain-containing protein [Paracoccaceae bacterium]
MSLMGTLAKVAIGVLVVKGVGGMLKGAQGGARGGARGDTRVDTGGGSGDGFGTGRDGRFGGPASPGRRTTGLEDMMGDILGPDRSGRGTGGHPPARRPSTADPFGEEGPVVAPEPGGPRGGLGDLLEEIGGRARGGARDGSGSGLDDILGKLGGAGGGGLGDLLGGILGGAAAGPATRGFGETLNEAFRNGGEPSARPSRDQEAAAALLLKAMIQAAKADGRIDEAEKKRLMDNLGQATAEEMAFVKRELAAPVDVRALAAQVPEGLQAQVYTMSLMAIDLDSRAEGRYLMELASELGLSQREVTAIHSHVGAAISAS